MSNRMRWFAATVPPVFLSAAMMLAGLAGCAIPLVPYAPDIGPIAEEAAPATGERSAAALALRRGHIVRSMPGAPLAGGPVAGMPPQLRGDAVDQYVPPPRFALPRAGDRHYYNFRVTPDFERASRAYYGGSLEEALQATDAMLAQSREEPMLLWQASQLRCYVLLVQGRYELAERETARTERLELAATGGNQAARSLRAEVRYWAGDVTGALADAAAVMRAFAGWRFPVFFPVPPIDQVKLARLSEAHIRALTVTGLALLASRRPEQALPWLALADQEMNNVMYVNRHPVYGIYFPAYRELAYHRGITLIAYGAALLATGASPDTVETAFVRANEYFDAVGYGYGRVLGQLFRVTVHVSRGQYREARAHAAAGIALAEQAQLLDALWRLEGLQGFAALQMGDEDEALRSLRKAQTLADLLAGTVTVDEGKVRFGVTQDLVTRALAGIDVKRNDVAALFDDLERGRARSFVALLANRQVAVGREAEITGRIRALDRDILAERQRKQGFSGAAVAVTARERDLLDERARQIARLRARDPDLADALSVQVASLRDAQAALQEKESLVYFLPATGDDVLVYLYITRNRAVVRKTGVTTSRLRALLGSMLPAVEDRDRQRQAEIVNAIATGLRIDGPRNTDVMYVVPSGDTHFIPWGALDLDGAVVVLPTGAWLSRSAPAVDRAPAAIVVGDPEFGGLLERLPGARAEAVRVAERYGVQPLLGPSATESAVRQSAGARVDVAHFATHALFDPVDPLKSALMLTDGRQPAPLTVERLFESPLNAKLVFLSACQTGLGEIAGGDDLIGLSRSFYLGGAAMILSSLWPVEDQATRLYMETFHRVAAAGSFSAAWIAARDAVRATGALPGDYGAFVLGGAARSSR